MIKNLKNLEKLVESWKFRCQQQCLVKHQQIAAEKPAAVLGNTRRNKLVLSMPTSPRDFDGKELLFGIMRIILQLKE